MRIRPGNTILEALLAVGIATVVVATVGNLIVAVNRVDRTSAHKDQAIGYARQALEIAALHADDWFACTSSSCTCTKISGYTSCWESCPVSGLNCDQAYGLDPSTFALTNDPSTISGTPFTRSITVVNEGGDPDLKRVTATISWAERDQPTKTVSQETILAGWKNITP